MVRYEIRMERSPTVNQLQRLMVGRPIKTMNLHKGGYDFNRNIPSSKGTFRPDAINFEDNIVHELEPDLPSGRCKDKRQLQGYPEYLNKHFPCDGNWTGFFIHIVLKK